MSLLTLRNVRICSYRILISERSEKLLSCWADGRLFRKADPRNTKFLSGWCTLVFSLINWCD